MKTSLVALALAGATILSVAPAAADPLNGPYVGVTTGWSRAELSTSPAGGQALDTKTTHDSVLFGFYGGYNHRVRERFLVGAEAGFSGTVDDALDASVGGAALRIDPRYSIDLSGRVGYFATEKALLYVRGGYAHQRVQAEVRTPAGLVREGEGQDGWLVGGGLEYALTERVSARLEYRFSDFSDGGARDARHQTLIGVSYNF